MLPNLVVREAKPADFLGLSTLLESAHNIHRHLDWRPPLNWLGESPFWVIEQKRRILAALACPTDPPGIAWIRLFAADPVLEVASTWDLLFSRVQDYFHDQPETTFAGIALYPWFGDLLRSRGFHSRQEIVILEWDNTLPQPLSSLSPVTIHPIEMKDLAAVADVDNQAFAPLWQNSYESLKLAYRQSAYATIAKLGGRIVGYQISTIAGYNAHLARLAVYPEQQQKSIGYWLVYDLLQHFSSHNVFRITVNTQDNNQASLALYQKLGFWPTGERFKVLIYP